MTNRFIEPQPSMAILFDVFNDQTDTESPVAWADFLAALEHFCARQGWHVEYGEIDDHSCAIFAKDVMSLPMESV